MQAVDGKKFSGTEDDAGECRRYPPHIVAVRNDGAWSTKAVYRDEWCGEWQETA